MMDSSNRKFIKKWRRVRRKGFMKYLLTQGLGFGVVVGGFNLLIVYIDNDETIVFDEVVIKAILIIASAAFLYAVVSWLINNFIYMKLK